MGTWTSANVKVGRSGLFAGLFSWRDQGLSSGFLTEVSPISFCFKNATEVPKPTAKKPPPAAAALKKDREPEDLELEVKDLATPPSTLRGRLDRNVENIVFLCV